jgi:hypothetical protein
MKLSKNLPGFTLIDVMISVVLTSVLVFFVATFARDVLHFSAFVSRHQLVRQEAFALMNTTLALMIREASAIDYSKSDEHQLALFMDKFERTRLTIVWDQEQGKVFIKKSTGDIALNSSRVEITDLVFSFLKPTDIQEFDDFRSLQPSVQITLIARLHQPDNDRSHYAFWEDPQISYTTSYTLRNYSASSLRHSSL